MIFSNPDANENLAFLRVMQMLSADCRVQELFLRFNTAIPSSAPVEWLFSAGGQILTLRRNRLSDDNFQMMLLLKANKTFKWHHLNKQSWNFISNCVVCNL